MFCPKLIIKIFFMLAVNVYISRSYSFPGSYQIITTQMYSIIYNVCKLGQWTDLYCNKIYSSSVL